MDVSNLNNFSPAVNRREKNFSLTRTRNEVCVKMRVEVKEKIEMR